MNSAQKKLIQKALRRRQMSRLNQINRAMQLQKICPRYRQLFRLFYAYRGMPLPVAYLRRQVVLGGYSTRQDTSTQLGSFHHAIRRLRQFLKGSEWEIRLFKEPCHKTAYGYGLYRLHSFHSLSWCKPHGVHTARIKSYDDWDSDIHDA